MLSRKATVRKMLTHAISLELGHAFWNDCQPNMRIPTDNSNTSQCHTEYLDRLLHTVSSQSLGISWGWDRDNTHSIIWPHPKNGILPLATHLVWYEEMNGRRILIVVRGSTILLQWVWQKWHFWLMCTSHKLIQVCMRYRHPNHHKNLLICHHLPIPRVVICT